MEKNLQRERKFMSDASTSGFQALADFNRFELRKFEKDNNVKIKFHSGLFNLQGDHKKRTICVALATIAIVCAVLILYSNKHSLSFLQKVDHKYAWILVGGAGVVIAPNIVYFFSLIYKHRKFVAEAKKALEEDDDHHIRERCNHVFGAITTLNGRSTMSIGKLTIDNWSSTDWKSYPAGMLTPKWKNGEEAMMYLYVEKKVHVVSIPQFPTAFEASLNKKRVEASFA